MRFLGNFFRIFSFKSHSMKQSLIKLAKYVIAITVISTAQTALSQKIEVDLGGGNHVKKAEEFWQSGAYASAANAYRKAAVKVKPKNEEAVQKKAFYTYMSATCYRLTRQFSDAEKYYEKAILLRYHQVDPKVYFYLAEMQMAQCKHTEAKENYEAYNQSGAGDAMTKVRLNSCERYDEMMAPENRTKHKVANESKLNTASFDYAAVMGPRGKEMYFSSSRSGSTGEETDPSTGESFVDIWVTKIDRNKNWGQPQPLPGTINTGSSEATICFDGRGKTMWFTHCPSGEDTRVGCQIMMAEKKGKAWGTPKKVTLKDHDTSNVGQPAVSPDGKTLIFASNMSGGEGGLDLWLTTYNKRKDEWSLPVNLGDDINTPGNDCFPTWGPDGELYYASNGLIGFGGLDIYRAERVEEKNKWQNPQNLGYPLNSCRDDYHLIYTERGKVERGYLSSNREGAKGNYSQDIWSFYLPPVLVDVEIVLSNAETGEAIPGATVDIMGSNGQKYTVTSDVSGRISLSEKSNGARYIEPGSTWTIKVAGVPKKYFSTSDQFSSVTDRNLKIIRELKVIPEKEVIRLPEVRYDLGKASLQVNETFNSKDSLNFLYDLMMENPTVVVELLAHTDSRGSKAANQLLSQRRADSCVAYLVNEKGMDSARLVPVGKGEESPAIYHEIDASGDTIAAVELTERYINQFQLSDPEKFEALHQRNRRTEGRIIRYDYVPKKEEEEKQEDN